MLEMNVVYQSNGGNTKMRQYWLRQWNIFYPAYTYNKSYQFNPLKTETNLQYV